MEVISTRYSSTREDQPNDKDLRIEAGQKEFYNALGQTGLRKIIGISYAGEDPTYIYKEPVIEDKFMLTKPA